MRNSFILILFFQVLASCSYMREVPNEITGIVHGVDDGMLFYELDNCRLYLDSTKSLPEIERLIHHELLNCELLQLLDCPPLQNDTTYCAFLTVFGYEGKVARLLGINSELSEDGGFYNFDLYYSSGNSSLSHCYFSLPALSFSDTSSSSVDYSVVELVNVRVEREL